MRTYCRQLSVCPHYRYVPRCRTGYPPPCRLLQEGQFCGCHTLAPVIVGWMLNIMLSLFLKCVFIHSIWSAYTLGWSSPTVDGRLMIMGFSLVAPHVSWTAVQISGKIQLCAGKALRGILQADLGIALCRIALDQLGSYDGDILYIFPILMEHHIPL